jgi:hypothetical protein
MEKLRLPFLILALIFLAVATMLEAGGAILGTGGDLPTGAPDSVIAIGSLALIDALLLYAVSFITAGVLVPERIHGRLQGVVTLIVSLLVLLGSILLFLAALALLLLMVALLTAIPFGIGIYMAAYADFPVREAAAFLSGSMTLKLAFALLMILAHQRFLQNRTLVLLTLTSLLATLVVAFLHAFPPSVLAAVTDAIAALVVALAAAIWALVLLIISIPSISRALRIDRAG